MFLLLFYGLFVLCDRRQRVREGMTRAPTYITCTLSRLMHIAPRGATSSRIMLLLEANLSVFKYAYKAHA